MKIILALIMFLTIACAAFGGEGNEAALLRRGAEKLGVKDYHRAVKAFREATRLNPASVEAHRGLGMAYLGLGSNEVASIPETLTNAAAAFSEALRLAPGSAETSYHLGVTYLALHDKNRAVKEYNSIKGLDPKLAQQLLTRISSYSAPISFYRERGSDNATPVIVIGNQVFVPVTFSHGNRTLEARLILDTGASVTAISMDLAEKLGIDLKRAPRARVQGVGGMLTVWHTKVDQISAGPHTKTGIDVAVLPHHDGVPIDGLLGMNFLRSYKYNIDLHNQVVEWAQ